MFAFFIIVSKIPQVTNKKNVILRFFSLSALFYRMISTLTKFICAFIFLLLLYQGSATSTCAGEVNAVAVATCAKTAQPVFKAASDIAKIPMTAADILRLPLGVIETGLFPLPFLELTDGLENIGRGVAAPFKLAIDVLSLPFDVCSALNQACSAAGKN